MANLANPIIARAQLAREIAQKAIVVAVVQETIIDKQVDRTTSLERKLQVKK